MRSSPCLIAATSALAALACAAPARADISSWLSAGGGAVSWTTEGRERVLNGAITMDMGVGTTPDARFIFGGLVRTTTVIDQGTEWAGLLRGATWGFQAGGFGLALDAGAYFRIWGADSIGFTGALNLGAPLGLTLSILGSVGTNDANAFGAVAALDLVRLTVYRQSLLDWWPNPNPAQKDRREARAPGRRYW